MWTMPTQPQDPSVYNDQAKVAFNNFPFARVLYWPFIRGDGTAGIQSRVELWPGAHALALDHQTGLLYLIRRKRHTNRGEITVTEIPNGGIDPGCTAFATAKQELLEEAGVVAESNDDWIQLTPEHGMQPIDGLAITQQHFFLCLRGKRVQDPEIGETDEVITVDFPEFFQLTHEGAFNDPMGPCLGLMAYLWLRQNRSDLLGLSGGPNAL